MAFNDPSLEEKVPTQGSVKVPTARRRAAVKAKKRTAKNIPDAASAAAADQAPQVLTGVTRNIHLNLSDLLDGLPPKEKGSQRRGIDKLVMRWNSQLKAIYTHYSMVGVSTNNPRNTFTMNQQQFMVFARECKLVTQQMPPVRIARVFSDVKIQLAQAVTIARQRREYASGNEEARKIQSLDDRLYMEGEDDIHSPSRPILFREFVEALVRIAAEVNSGGELRPSLKEQFCTLLDSKVKRNAASGPMRDHSGVYDYVERSLRSLSAVKWLTANDGKLRKIYARYSVPGSYGSGDRALVLQDLALMLRDCGIVGADSLSISEVVMSYIQAAFGASGADGGGEDENDVAGTMMRRISLPK